MITKRDQDIIKFLEDFHIATSNQIHELFFNNSSYRYSRMRLQYLSKEQYIRKTRSTITNGYAYYVEQKPYQIHHDLLRTEIYLNIKKEYEIINWQNEVPIADIRPDAFAYINNNGIIYPTFVEIHLNKNFNFNKYKELLSKFDFKLMFKIKPIVIIFTDRRVTIQNMNLRFKIVNFNSNNKFEITGLNKIFN